MSRIEVLHELPALQALTHPVRVRMLDLLRQPHSAASMARALGQPRQKINYHLKELEAGGLVRLVGERKRGNMTEQLYRAVAGSFLISPRIAWGGEARGRALADQASLAALVDLGERLQRDAAGLLDRAAYDGEAIPSASVEVDVAFADEAARSAFMTEYLEALGPLLKKYAVSRSLGAPFKLALAIYPNPEEEAEQ